MCGFHGVKNICVDSGYESEENYCWFEENGVMKLYVKPSNHEQRKTRKYRTDISRRENMAYDAEADTYTCANGKTITFDGVKKLQLQRLCRLPSEREVHPGLRQQEATGRAQ